MTLSGSRFERVSRRDVLLAALATTSFGCDAGSTPARSASAAATAPAAPTQLQVVRMGQMRDDERGGTLVVLLHGWGARGDDLVSLARALERPGVRFVLPAAPLAEGAGGRAWWHLDDQRPPRAAGGELPQGHVPSRQLQTVREAVQELLHASVQRQAPESIALVGFSQGAMLALDVALAASPPVHRVAALSGALLADSLPALKARRATHLSALIAHGRRDPVVPFQSGELARDLLSSHGVSVDFHAFDGGHTIPRDVVDALQRFSFSS